MALVVIISKLFSAFEGCYRCFSRGEVLYESLQNSIILASYANKVVVCMKPIIVALEDKYDWYGYFQIDSISHG